MNLASPGFGCGALSTVHFHVRLLKFCPVRARCLAHLLQCSSAIAGKYSYDLLNILGKV